MSTHALMRAGVMQLHRWRVLDDLKKSGAQPVRTTSFFYGRERLCVDIKPTPMADALYAPRRYLLDAALARAAVAAGAEIRYGVGCHGLVADADGRVTGVRLRSGASAMETLSTRLVIGADGRRSSVARFAGATTLTESKHASAVLYGYFEGPENQGYRWYWEKGAAGGLIPTNCGQSCAFVALPAARAEDLRRKNPADLVVMAQTLVPEMGKALAGTVPTSPLTMFAGQHGRVRQCLGPGWALVGDAGYFKDPISAHGITDALRDAEILARAIISNRLADYPRLRKALSADFFHITDDMASFAWSLEELAELHRKLNGEMKAEQAWVAGLDSPSPQPTAA